MFKNLLSSVTTGIVGGANYLAGGISTAATGFVDGAGYVASGAKSVASTVSSGAGYVGSGLKTLKSEFDTYVRPKGTSFEHAGKALGHVKELVADETMAGLNAVVATGLLLKILSFCAVAGIATAHAVEYAFKASFALDLASKAKPGIAPLTDFFKNIVTKAGIYAFKEPLIVTGAAVGTVLVAHTEDLVKVGKNSFDIVKNVAKGAWEGLEFVGELTTAAALLPIEVTESLVKFLGKGLGIFPAGYDAIASGIKWCANAIPSVLKTAATEVKEVINDIPKNVVGALKDINENLDKQADNTFVGKIAEHLIVLGGGEAHNDDFEVLA